MGKNSKGGGEIKSLIGQLEGNAAGSTEGREPLKNSPGGTGMTTDGSVKR